MPYKVVHVIDRAAEVPGTIDYDDLADLLDDDWLIEDVQEVPFKGSTVERYRLRKGAEERGVATQQSRGVATAADPLAMPSGGAAQQLAALLAGQASHLGPSAAHQFPGMNVVSGNAHMMIDQDAQDARKAGRGAESCPFEPGTDAHDMWMRHYRSASGPHDR